MPTTALSLASQPGGLEHLDLAVVHAAEALAKCGTVDEAQQIRDQAVALNAYVASIKAGREAENSAREIVLRAERRIGEIVDMQLPLKTERGGGAPKKRGAGDDASRISLKRDAGEDDDAPNPTPRAAAIAAMGLTRLDVSRCRKLAAVPEAQFEQHVSRVKARGEKLTRSGTIAVSDAEGHDGNAWGTPPRIVGAVRKVFGGEIDLDPASNDRAQRVVNARKYYTVADDGLARTWKSNAMFCNPPYEQPAVTRFCEKFIAEHQSGRMTRGIMLLNASTDTSWFRMLADRFPVCFTLGRIGFLLPDGRQVDGNRVGQAFFAAGCGQDFARVFEDPDDPIGIVMQRVGLR